jgi:hypothetical protein
MRSPTRGCGAAVAGSYWFGRLGESHAAFVTSQTEKSVPLRQPDNRLSLLRDEMRVK